ncbi:hypothetical protein BS47DRAFT_1076166 [Hydnum rufescens UP504]|uniref:Uncharacterized protein n=1 Tax=Hydnum rufescens UP504 TaxID=1448309 RepID=A0A9P6E1P7_9AGAM|nr:hypothetical protein BS47DRAFT_1076166 [Hydnum rufescens UP504]
MSPLIGRTTLDALLSSSLPSPPMALCVLTNRDSLPSDTASRSLLLISSDKTAERFSKMSTAAGSVARRSGKVRKSTTELRQSWEHLERERDLKTIVNLPVVADESYGESTMVASTSEEKTVEENGGKMDRMTLWIKSVEKVVEETRHEFQREASTCISRSPSRGGMLDSRPPSAMGPIPLSLPPPKRRATVSSTQSRRPSTSDGHHKSRSVLDLGPGRAPSIRSVEGGPVEGKRLSAILGPSDRKLFQEGRNPSKQPSCSSLASSAAHHTPKSVPMIEVVDASGPVQNAEEVPAQHAPAVEQTKSHWGPDTTLDYAQLNRSASSGFYNEPRNPLSSRSASLSPPPIPTSYKAPNTNTNTSPPQSPQNPKDEGTYERLLLSAPSVVRHGKGYQSDQSLRPVSSTFYQVHHPSTEFILESTADTVEEPRSRSRQFQNNSLSAKTKSHRRGGIFATLRGREQAEAVAFAREFGAPEKPIEPPGSGTPPDPEHESSTNDRRDTLTLRMKRAFMRVVSTPVTTRAIAVGALS